ncbi:unnamed protein product [Ostreobium quekettii]|uniref:Uncharacterized protein n=1 Tax=Ostreobium quekettii TaxID=121088 RepID=A0A8S1IP83_9CHLO|nr:unnamed protein product [Ostreobium quekettii]|eukprot:evm.model.scf_35.13 EVM.evm.TU.scf_35.13   scf_35:112680-116792(-)
MLGNQELTAKSSYKRLKAHREDGDSDSRSEKAKTKTKKTGSAIGVWVCGGMLAYMQFFQVPLSLAVLSVFDCVKCDPTGNHYMEAEPYVRCYTFAGTWRRLCIPAAFFLLTYVAGIPLVMYGVAKISSSPNFAVSARRKYVTFVVGFHRSGPTMIMSILHPSIALLAVCLLTVARDSVLEYEVLRSVGALITMMWYHSTILTFKPHKAYRQVNLVASMLTASHALLVLSGVVTASPLSGSGVTSALCVMNVTQITVLYVAGSACMSWFLSPLCRDVELWIKSMVAEQFQMKEIMAKRKRAKDKSKGIWKSAFKTIQGMHSVVSVWRTVDNNMSAKDKWKKGEKAAKMLQVLERRRAESASQEGARGPGTDHDDRDERARAVISAQISLEAMALSLLPAGQEAALDLMKDDSHPHQPEQFMRWFRQILAYYKCTTELKQDSEMSESRGTEPFEDSLHVNVRNDVLEQMSRRRGLTDNRIYAALLEYVNEVDRIKDVQFDGVWEWGKKIRSQLDIFKSVIDQKEEKGYLKGLLAESRDEGAFGKSQAAAEYPASPKAAVKAEIEPEGEYLASGAASPPKSPENFGPLELP